MKKIINGKVYDTDKAKAVGRYADGEDRLSRIAETLYRKRTGEFFLHGEGGAATSYAEPRGDGGWAPGERIAPLSYKTAQEWAENRLSADDYEEIFGEVQEDDGKTTVSLSLPASLYEQVKRSAAVEGIGLSAYVEKALRAGVCNKCAIAEIFTQQPKN